MYHPRDLLLATTGQIEQVREGIEKLAGGLLIPWMDSVNPGQTMEQTVQWMQMDGDVYQAHTLSMNTGTLEQPTVQERWRLDRFKRLGGLPVEVVSRDQIQVNRYTKHGTPADTNLPMNLPRRQYPTAITLHNGVHTLGATTGYFAQASALRTAREADESGLFTVLEETARRSHAGFDVFRFSDIIEAAENPLAPDRPIPLYFTDEKAVSIFGARMALTLIRSLTAAEVINKPADLPE